MPTNDPSATIPLPLSSCTSATAVTPSDSATLSKATRALWVGGAGNLAVVFAADNDPVILTGVPVGRHEFRVKQVRASSTTATSIVALY